MKEKPSYWKSLKTGNTFDYYQYSNHGHGGSHCAFVPGEGMICRDDLPKNEYPYTIVYTNVHTEKKLFN